jgi:hypothetical protein
MDFVHRGETSPLGEGEEAVWGKRGDGQGREGGGEEEGVGHCRSSFTLARRICGPSAGEEGLHPLGPVHGELDVAERRKRRGGGGEARNGTAEGS